MNSQILETTFLDNSITAYLLAGGTILLGFILANLARAIVVQRLQRWAQRTRISLDDAAIRVLTRSLVPAIYLGSLYIALSNLNLHPILGRSLEVLGIIVTTILGLRLVTNTIEYALRAYTLRQDNPNLEQGLQALLPAIRLAVWVIGAIFLLANLNFDVSAIIASLGVGSLAIAIASQGILADLFSYFSILLDRPFELGDFIALGDYLGTVERIGVKTTRLVSLSGEELVIANTELTGSRLRNFKRMKRRRVCFHLGVVYETPVEKLAMIPGLLAAIIRNVESVSFDRAHFASYGDFSLNYEVVYFVEGSDYNLYMDVQQRIYLALFRAFAEHGIEFAYPTQVTLLNTQADSEQVKPEM